MNEDWCHLAPSPCLSTCASPVKYLSSVGLSRETLADVLCWHSWIGSKPLNALDDGHQSTANSVGRSPRLLLGLLCDRQGSDTLWWTTEVIQESQNTFSQEQRLCQQPIRRCRKTSRVTEKSPTRLKTFVQCISLNCLPCKGQGTP
jgi:hypothetical protein